MKKMLVRDVKKVKPGWAIQNGVEGKHLHSKRLRSEGEADDGYVQTGLESDIPTNYENQLIGNPKGLTDFEVNKGPGRLG